MGTEDVDQDINIFYKIFKWIAEVEKGTAGRINMFFAFFVGVGGYYSGKLFTLEGIILVSFIIMSAIINQILQETKERYQYEH